MSTVVSKPRRGCWQGFVFWMTRSHNSRRGASRGSGSARQPRYQVDARSYSDRRWWQYQMDACFEDEDPYDDRDPFCDPFCDDEEPATAAPRASLAHARLDARSSEAGDADGSASEWSIVTSAASEWAVVACFADEAGPSSEDAVQWWPADVRSDETIAHVLQLAERQGPDGPHAVEERLGPAGRHGLPAGERRHRLQAEPPRVPEPLLRELQRRLGTCVVCGEAAATVVHEPCGHLALCGGCHDAWPRETCVLCRTRGAPVHLVRGSADDACAGVCVLLADGGVSVPSLAPDPTERTQGQPNLKLARRRAMRSISREVRMRRRTADAESTARRGGGRLGARAREAAELESWRKHSTELAAWKRQLRMMRDAAAAAAQGDWGPTREAMRRLFPRMVNPPSRHYVQHYMLRAATAPRPDVVQVGGIYSGKRRGWVAHRPTWEWRVPWTAHETSSARHPSKQLASQQKAGVRAEAAQAARLRAEARAARAEQARLARAAAEAAVAEAAGVASAAVECVACGVAEASMLALPCRHRSLCRPCWEVRERAGEVCARCGDRCQLMLCVYRP